MTDEEIAQLTELFLGIAAARQYGRVYLVEPQVVLEIACDQIQDPRGTPAGSRCAFRGSSESAGTSGPRTPTAWTRRGDLPKHRQHVA